MELLIPVLIGARQPCGLFGKELDRRWGTTRQGACEYIVFYYWPLDALPTGALSLGDGSLQRSLQAESGHLCSCKPRGLGIGRGEAAPSSKLLLHPGLLLQSW